MGAKLKNPDERIRVRRSLRDLVFKAGGDRCLSCGACVAGCPIADWDEQRLDPRRMVRLIQNGLGDLLVEHDWIWQCTNCGKCTCTCPAGVDLSAIISAARGLVAKDASPGQIQKTADLHRTTSNNMQLTPEDWIETLEWMAEELQDELPAFELPVEVQGAELYATINSKLPMYYPAELQDIFKVFHSAGASWTLAREWWEGTNYAMFTGDLETWEETLRKQVARVQELGCRTMAYTECGHGYYATLSGLKRFGIDAGFEIVHVVQLYARWIEEGRFKLDPSRNPQRITLHDPCNAVRVPSMAGFPDIADASRYVLSRVCENFVEMSPNREANYCCSGGGGALIAGFKRARSHYGRAKVDQVDRSGADLVCTPCVNCFDGIGGLAAEYERPWKPIHLWKLLARAIQL